jgi:hypothetical protein
VVVQAVEEAPGQESVALGDWVVYTMVAMLRGMVEDLSHWRGRLRAYGQHLMSE